MEKHHYLTSGVLEAYLLGLVSDNEKQELERVLSSDPDVLAELNELEMQMEQYFLENAVPPPPGVRTAIEQRINGTEIQKQEPVTQSRSGQPTPEPEPSKPNYVDVTVSDTHIQVHKNWRVAFIAIFVLSKVFLILGLYYYFKASSLEQEILRLKASVQQEASRPPVKTP